MAKIGIDLVLIKRYENKDTLAKKVLSSNEYKEYLNSLDKATFLASRFCLKEALLKCLEKGILEVNLSEIEVRHKENGCPFIVYQDKIYDCSLSHENEYCVGVVMND